MRDIRPVRVGLLIDYLDEEGRVDPNVLRTLHLVAEEHVRSGLIDRPVEFVVQAVMGLPRGSFRAVRDAFHALVEQDVLVIFGPWVSENAVALRRYVDELASVPCITIAASESLLSEWMFALPSGSLEEEPIIIANVARFDGCRSVGIAHESSLIGDEYLRAARAACGEQGLRITAEVAIPQVQAEQADAMKVLAEGAPDALIHVGFGYGVAGMNDALAQIGWSPRRYTTTAFEFASRTAYWRQQFAGWIGLDQYDERNPVGQEFLDRFEKRYGERPAYFFPLVCYDVGRLILLALSRARPLTGEGVKRGLEQVKMLPAATGAPGTRMRFGRFIRQGWVGSEFLVARRVLPDGSAIVMHATINGLIPVHDDPERDAEHPDDQVPQGFPDIASDPESGEP